MFTSVAHILKFWVKKNLSLSRQTCVSFLSYPIRTIQLIVLCLLLGNQENAWIHYHMSSSMSHFLFWETAQVSKGQRKTERESQGGQREKKGDGERSRANPKWGSCSPQAGHDLAQSGAQASLDAGLELRTVRSWPEPSLKTEPSRHPLHVSFLYHPS